MATVADGETGAVEIEPRICGGAEAVVAHSLPRIAALSKPRVSEGLSPRSAEARRVSRISDVSAAASGPLPQTSPITAAQLGLLELKEVVEIAADLAGHGAEAGGDLEALDLRQRAGHQRPLQRPRQVSLLVVELGVAEGDGGALGELLGHRDLALP